MTDRELLELAAKAAGIEVHWHESASGDDWCFIPSAKAPFNRRASDQAEGTIWNPLTDDGDALRLAVGLNMSAEISEHEAATYVYAGPVPRVHAVELWRDDKDAATRRAITRAAAAMAQAEKGQA